MWHPFKKRAVEGPRREDLPEPNTGNPESERPQGLCPRCGKQSSFENVGELPVTFREYVTAGAAGIQSSVDALDKVVVLRCRNCRQGIMVIEEMWVGDGRPGDNTSGTVWFKGIFWWPLPGTVLGDDVPVDIRDAFAEAARTLAANCPRACIVMARRCLEAVTVAKGQTTGTLRDRLVRLADANILHPTLVEWANEVRLTGNLGAHFDPITHVSPEDAARLLAFLRQLLHYLFELPAELQRARDARVPPVP